MTHHPYLSPLPHRQGQIQSRRQVHRSLYARKEPRCATVAAAVTDTVAEEDLVDRSSRLGEYFNEGLEEQKDVSQYVGDVGGLGLNLAVDLIRDQATRERATEQAAALMAYCMEQGISLKLIRGNVLNLKPSLVITKDEIDYVLEVLRTGLVSLNTTIMH